jgi:hypothetical protein
MSDFYSKENLKNSTFLPYPMEFVFNPVLRAIPAQAKELYAVLRYRINLSARNNDFCDEKGLFVLYNQKELEEQTGMAERTIKYWFSLARKNFLIETVRQAPGLPQKIYVANIDYVIRRLAGQDVAPQRCNTVAPLWCNTVAPQRCNTVAPQRCNTVAPLYREERIHRKNTGEEETKRNDFGSSSEQFRVFANGNSELLNALYGWEEARSDKNGRHVPLTSRAAHIALMKLQKLSGGDVQMMIAILDQSTMCGYQGLFELRQHPEKKESKAQAIYKALESL